jgi:glucose/arabinose dehydrogenase
MRSRIRHLSRARPHRRRLVLERLECRTLLATLPPNFTETPVAAGLSNPTAMEFAPNGDLWVLEQAGQVKRFRPGSTTADVVSNLSTLGLSSSGERGVLGIAFDPQYATNKRVFIYYTATSPATHNRISRFTVNDTDPTDYFFNGPNIGGTDAGTTGTPTQTVIFDLDNLSAATNHNGGAIHFGPDGKLYVAVGENANPAHAQTLSNVLGKILRMNSDGTAPSDNPFFSSTTGKQQTIWALGLRNPFTFAFQPGSGRMFINDVGQNTWEEIDDGIAGSNYGWPSIEGNQGTPPTSPGTYRGPLYAYSHGSGPLQGFAITGGAFYNPAIQQFPSEFAGDYFFADFVNDWINVLDVGSGNVTPFATGASGAVDLRVANDGSLYYLARNFGQVFRVNSSSPPTQFPWHNAQFAVDVDADGEVAGIDALEIINRINAIGPGPLAPPSVGNSPPPFYDVSRDNFLAAIDALLVINYLNSHAQLASAGEGESAAADVAHADSSTTLDDLLIADIAETQAGRRKGQPSTPPR